MNVSTNGVRVGIRELKNNLSRFVARVGEGEEIVVTDHGKPVARLVPVDGEADGEADVLQALISSGVVTAPPATARRLPKRRVQANGTVSDLVARQRR